ncbi:hypothetical protein [Paracoccus sp. (in: a-proteobacteria)]|uniref:hypothetical protein n=1 Tax=Paracoccus sp. TaxID=267 RepID=UPI003A8A4734
MKTTTFAKRGLLALALTSISLLPQTALADNLWPGEVRKDAAGYPAVAYFQKGETDKPLIVFIPGAHHAARIAYGGHEGARPEDFLAHHLAQKGYNFLALSYPIATTSGMIGDAAPDFTAEIWGKQIAEISRHVIKDNDLSGELVVMAWSMGGKVVQPAYEALNAAGLPVDTFISLAATPGLPGLIAYSREYDMAATGYATRPNAYPGWLRQLAETAQIGGTDTAIPEGIYVTDYVGDIPIALQGYGQVYRDGAYVFDHLAQALDYGAFEFTNYPYVIVLEGNSTLDARHGLLDRSYWTLYNANTVQTRYQGSMKEVPGALPAANWDQLQNLVHGLSDRLTIQVGGNHFFFVGEAGAARTADAVEEAMQRVDALQAELADLLSERAE